MVRVRGGKLEGVKTRNSLYGFDYVEEDRRRVKDRKTYEIKQLWQRSHEIINLSARGFSNVQVAEVLGICPETVSATINSELGQRKLSEIRLARDEEAKKVSREIASLTNKALKVYNEIFDDESGQVTLKDKKATADTVMLDLSGHRAPTRIQKHSVHTNLTSEELERFKKRGIEAARKSGMVIDVTEESNEP